MSMSFDQNLEIVADKKGANHYRLTPCFYCGAWDRNRIGTVGDHRGILSLQIVARNAALLLIFNKKYQIAGLNRRYSFTSFKIPINPYASSAKVRTKFRQEYIWKNHIECSFWVKYPLWTSTPFLSVLKYQLAFLQRTTESICRIVKKKIK